MKKSAFLHLSGLCILFTSSFAIQAHAQSYLGSFDPVPEESATEEETVQSPIPRTFSSNLSDRATGAEIDTLYNNLIITLWVYASADFITKKNLILLVDNKKFQMTRYKEEFSRPLDKAMKTLNMNYEEIQYFVKDAQEKYKDVSARLSKRDQEIVQPIWDQKIEEFSAYAKKYFQMQSQFLKSYHTFAGFILNTAGEYYYDSKSKKLHFYDYSDYEYFGSSLDKLLDINHKQLKHVKSLVPAKSDIILSAE